MSIGTPRGLLLFFSALAHISGALGGLKWSSQTKHAHRIYIATQREPCNPAIACPADDALWSAALGESEPQVAGLPLCESLRKSFNELHSSLHGECPNPVAAECASFTCFFVMDTSSPTSLCGRKSTCRKKLKTCAKTIVDEHVKFMKNENKFLELRKTPKPTNPCSCPHCRHCPLAVYGCPYCPRDPRKVDPRESERPEEEYAGMREIVGSLNIPALSARGKSKRNEPPLSMASMLSNAAKTSSRTPSIPALAYQTPNSRPILNKKGKQIDYPQYSLNQPK